MGKLAPFRLVTKVPPRNFLVQFGALPALSASSGAAVGRHCCADVGSLFVTSIRLACLGGRSWLPRMFVSLV